eukprot:CAMPEP_0178398452 /NCGR_PEP_ID=MMETSP0689_2-20121128/14779_1 /TAXON_ID=160604 /ORGANISM="Amphidinium massartii, Strain CS-259" /LENGTH=326 /DNA_ID=CAMNT_0020019213 /DNA_START=115 /DNA_END=1095 /DNA_ORIENTATION=+
MGCGDSKATSAAAPAAKASSTAPAAAAQQAGRARPQWAGKRFQVKLDTTWKDYDKDENVMITRAFLVGQPHCRFTLRGAEYTIDFKHMSQTNLSTGKVREIRAPPGMKQPKNPLLPAGPMIVLTVKAGQPGTAIMVADPNNPGQQVQVAVPKNAKVGSKLAVPVPRKGEKVEDVMRKQQGMSAGGKVALAGAGIIGLGAVAVGGIVLGDYLTGGELGTEDMAADAGDAIVDAAEAAHDAVVDDAVPAIVDAAEAAHDAVVDDAAPAVVDAAEAAHDAVVDDVVPAVEDAAEAVADAAEWTADAAEDTAAWFEDAGDTIGDVVMDLF